MILAIDIGNSNISLGVVEDKRVKKTWFVKTVLADFALKKEFHRTIVGIKKYSPSPDAIIICSVVPKTLKIVTPILRKTFNRRPLVIGRDIKVPMRNLYRKPYQVGQDRLVGAYGAQILYGMPAIIIDFGTATTFDVVSKKGEYLGGVIVPGLRLSTESLFEKTALLPKVKIRRPEGVIGKDTENSILSGISYGYGFLCDGMIRLISKQIKQKPVVVITGGYAEFIKKFIKRFDYIDKSLVFKGMYFTYQKY